MKPPPAQRSSRDTATSTTRRRRASIRRSCSQAIAATQHLYRANVFPTMKKATWGVYRDNLGHTTSDGMLPLSQRHSRGA